MKVTHFTPDMHSGMWVEVKNSNGYTEYPVRGWAIVDSEVVTPVVINEQGMLEVVKSPHRLKFVSH